MAYQIKSALRQRRETLSLKPVQVAAAADISLSYLYTLEGDGAVPGLEVARRLALALDTTVDVLWPAQPQEAA